MPQLIPFQFHSHDVRVLTDEENTPWWVVADVCAILGLTNPSKVAGRLKPNEIKTLTFDYTPYLIVNEQGLYRLIMRSNKPDAERFQDWVFQEVLPQIRKTGSYTHPASSAIDQFPELKAIVELAQSTAEARVAAEEARQKAHEAEIRAVRAETKADMALDEAHRMTIEEFITKNGLLGKWPYSEHKQIAGWLRKFCESYGLPTWKVAVYGKPWKDEIAYPLQACAAWLRMALQAPRQLQIVPSVPVTDTGHQFPVPGIEVR